MSTYMQASGTITLLQIRNLWIANGYTGYTYIRGYAGAQCFTHPGDGFPTISTTNINIKQFYACTPISPGTGGDPGGGGGGK